MLTIMLKNLSSVGYGDAFLLFGAILVLSLVQPLLPSRSYLVTATNNGAPLNAELLQPLGSPGLYYLHLPDAPYTYQWLAVAFHRQSAFIPTGLYDGWFGSRYIHTDQRRGVRLNDGKVDDHWTVAFDSTGVQCTNPRLSITLRKR